MAPRPIGSSVSDCSGKGPKVSIVRLAFANANREADLVYCQEGSPQCDALQKEGKRPWRRVREEYECQGGKREGAYQAWLEHLSESERENGVHVEARFKGDLLDGESRHYRLDTSLCRVHHYKNGLLEGVTQHFLAGAKSNSELSGRKPDEVTLEAHFHAGLLHGKISDKHPASRYNFIARYENGRRQGVRKSWDPKHPAGYTEERFENDRMVDQKVVNQDGRVISKKNSAQLDRENEAMRKAVIESRNPAPPPSKWLLLAAPTISGGIAKRDKDSDSVSRGGRLGGQLTLWFPKCMDWVCMGKLLDVGGEQSLFSKNPTWYAEWGGAGFALFYGLHYGIGAVYDDRRGGIQATAGIDFLLIGLYARARFFPNPIGGELTAGASLAVPVGWSR